MPSSSRPIRTLGQIAAACDDSEISKSEEAEAVKSIIDDYLTCDDTYPRSRNGVYGRRVIDAGDFLEQALDPSDIRNALRKIAASDVSDLSTRFRGLIEDEAPAWILKNYPDLVQERAEEMRDERTED